MQFSRRGQPAPLGVLYDSSLDGGIDQVLALAMLFGFAALQQVRIPRSRTQIDTKGGSDGSERARTESESFRITQQNATVH